MTSSRTKVIWITGASSGLGYSLAQRYLEQGHRVIASARKESALAELRKAYPEQLEFLAFDVSDENQVTTVSNQLSGLTDQLDCAILNAGTCEYLDMETPDWSLFERVNEVNYMGVVRSVRVCLPLLEKTPNSHLVGVSSQAVQAPFIRSEAYGASKAAVRYLMSSLRLDLAPNNIDVTCILPGFVDTPLTQKNDFDMPFIMSADEASRRIVKAIEKRVFEYAFPKRLTAVLALSRLMPHLWFKRNARTRS